MTYKDLVAEFNNKPRDLHTIPLKKRAPLWFYVHSENDAVYVFPAEAHKESSRISYPRKLMDSEFEKMLELYHLRKKGVPVSEQATMVTRNQVYWYGIFAELNL